MLSELPCLRRMRAPACLTPDGSRRLGRGRERNVRTRNVVFVSFGVALRVCVFVKWNNRHTMVSISLYSLSCAHYHLTQITDTLDDIDDTNSCATAFAEV